MSNSICSDGVGRSGTFITIHAQMERMKSEGVIDVFQFIKSVRFQRAGLVTNEVRICLIMNTNTSFYSTNVIHFNKTVVIYSI